MCETQNGASSLLVIYQVNFDRSLADRRSSPAVHSPQPWHHLMKFAVRIYDDDDGGGAAEPRIRMNAISVVSQEQNWSKISRVSERGP